MQSQSFSQPTTTKQLNNMKRLFILLAAAMMAVSMMAENEMITVYVPAELPIRDNVVVVNRSMCTILQAVVAQANGKNYTAIGSCRYLDPGNDKKIAEYDNNGLSWLRGSYISIKVRGTKTFVEGEDDMRMQSNAEKLAEDDIITDFTIAVEERRHDLYIYIYDKVQGSDQPAAPIINQEKPTMEVSEITRENIQVILTNNTAQTINRVIMRVRYISNGIITRVQMADVNVELAPNDRKTIDIARNDKEKYSGVKIDVEVVNAE